LGDIHLQREEATALLKELLEANLVVTSYINLKENKHCHFDLVIKGDCDPVELKQFIEKKDLALLVDKEQGTCKIYKP
jgi:hypothetical protein